MDHYQAGELQVDIGECEGNDGIVGTAETGDKTYLIEIGGQTAAVRQYCRQQHAGRSELKLVFSLSSPLRFNVGVKVPAGCINACATLNGQMLIGWFGGFLPDDLPGSVISGCQEHGTPVSTLRPGQVQNISFRWQDGDRLLFYWIWS